MTRKHLTLIILIIALISPLFLAIGNSVSHHTQVTNIVSAINLELNDGPYVFIESDSAGISKSIVNGIIKIDTIKLEKSVFVAEKSVFDNIDQIAALSDIHGQLDVLLELLKSNQIIDQKGNWAFGNGHFVITGDVFDRGPKVTETLWFIYELEKQAKEAGGKVHYLMGNHEYMVLHNDLRYIHEKYAATSELFQLDYPELFDDNTLLGRWLMSKSTIIKINDNLFVHGGLSNEFMTMKLTLEEANDRYRKSINMTREEIKSSENYNGLYSSSSPIWYRGYFGGKDAMAEADLASILSLFNAKHIIVGHTSQNKVKTDYHSKLYVVDTSIKNGKSGELLLIDNGEYYRCKMNGKRIKY